MTNLNFHPLEVVSRYRDTQLQVTENLRHWATDQAISCPENTRHSPKVELMLGQRSRRWAASTQHWVNVSCLLG